MGFARCAALLVGWVALLAGCRVPPERNPPPALSAPAIVSVVLSDAHPLAGAARLAVRRLNESRAPSERPVQLEIGPRASAGQVLVPVTADAPGSFAGLILVPRRGSLPESHQVDPAMPLDLLGDDLLAAHALGLYDAVLLAGVVARSGPDATADLLVARLRATAGRFALGEISYAQSLEPPLGPSAIVRELPR